MKQDSVFKKKKKDTMWGAAAGAVWTGGKKGEQGKKVNRTQGEKVKIPFSFFWLCSTGGPLTCCTSSCLSLLSNRIKNVSHHAELSEKQTSKQKKVRKNALIFWKKDILT